MVLDDYCSRISNDDTQSRLLGNTRASDGGFQGAAARSCHISSEIVSRVPCCMVLTCGLQVVTCHRRNLSAVFAPYYGLADAIEFPPRSVG